MCLGNSSGQADVSVVIVNFNAGALLAECVCRALEQARQVIVVDNGSSDLSLSLLGDRFGGVKNLQVIRNGFNAGFSAACNVGIHAATMPYVLFLNPDCLLNGSSLERMVSALESDERVGMAGGMLLNPDGTEQRGSRRSIPTPWRSLVFLSGLQRLADRWPQWFADFNHLDQSLPENSIETEAVSGAFMMVKKSALLDVGFLDDGYFLHCEDLDLCMRLRQKGWKIIFVPDASGVHYKGACSARHAFVEWHKHKGMMRFYRKFFRHQYPVLLMLPVAAGVWLHFGITMLLHYIVHFPKLMQTQYAE
jgi:hypothetical protein